VNTVMRVGAPRGVLSVTVNASETLTPNTINPGTRLIEEGAHLPESL
jgi:hypothetical protein